MKAPLLSSFPGGCSGCGGYKGSKILSKLGCKHKKQREGHNMERRSSVLRRCPVCRGQKTCPIDTDPEMELDRQVLGTQNKDRESSQLSSIKNFCSKTHRL